MEPIGIVTLDGQWYLGAWCRLRGGRRAFRLDRIRQAATGPEPVPRRPDHDLAWDDDVPVRLRELAIVA